MYGRAFCVWLPNCSWSTPCMPETTHPFPARIIAHLPADGKFSPDELPTSATCASIQPMQESRRICDYENSSYRDNFWQDQGREYEDLVERTALRRLLPVSGRRLLDIGAGFGRLSEFYAGYDEVVLLDYSRSLLREAQNRLGRDGRIRYVAADFYAMPFAESAFDTTIMVRVIHHVEDVPALLDQVARVLCPSGSYVLEFASKRHLKSILRYLSRRQEWNPFDQAPYEFVEMNFNFHPSWMRARLLGAGFHVKRQLTVSHFRLAPLKRLVPARILAAFDGVFQPTGDWWQLTPSVFVLCTAGYSNGAPFSHLLFACPGCSATQLDESHEAIACTNCGRRWPIDDGIYDFKTPLAA
jgi:SAM-dependent methyltransferase